MTKCAIVHVNDWNTQDKYYEAPITIIKELQSKIKDIGLEDAWQWWVNQVNYNNIYGGGPIKFGTVDMTLNHFFLDYNNELESISEWSFE